MAKKRGRGPMKWFFLGLFFNIFALIALFLMGNADGYSPQNHIPGVSTPQPSFQPYIAPPPAQRPNVQQQNGQVDLNSLRDAVRRNTPSSAAQNPGAGTYSASQEDERVEFQRHIDLMMLDLVYPNVPSGTNDLLKQMWARLGKNLVDSGLAGGVNDDFEFYVMLDNGTPIYFAPYSKDGTTRSLAVQFGMPIKRYVNLPNGLEQWAIAQPVRQSIEATLMPIGAGPEHVLWAMACYEPAQVSDQTLGALCNSVFNEASRIRSAVPKKFGGILV